MSQGHLELMSARYSAQTLSSFRAAVDLIMSSQRIAIVSHYNPDPDAYGSSCGLALAIGALQPPKRLVRVFNESGALPGLTFIPGVSEVVSSPGGESSHFDLLCVCDCGDIERIGAGMKAQFSPVKQIINIDHHFSNTCFGSVNIVHETASSASEMVFDLIKLAGWPILPDCAKALYAGISADTGSFKYLSTSAHTFRVAAELVQMGAEPAQIAEELYSDVSAGAVKLQSRVLLGAKFHADGKLCELLASEKDFRESGCGYEEAEGLVERGREISGVAVSVFMRWDGEIWRVSMRSRSDQHDVSQVAREFGGGGHKVAAAFRHRRDLESLRAALIPRLVELVSK